MSNVSGRELAETVDDALRSRGVRGLERQNLLREISGSLLRLAGAEAVGRGSDDRILLASPEANLTPEKMEELYSAETEEGDRYDEAAREAIREAATRGETLSYEAAARIAYEELGAR